MTDREKIELRLKCLELVVKQDMITDVLETAEKYYEFIIKA